MKRRRAVLGIYYYIITLELVEDGRVGGGGQTVVSEAGREKKGSVLEAFMSRFAD